jgi:hypothetical protein
VFRSFENKICGKHFLLINGGFMLLLSLSMFTGCDNLKDQLKDIQDEYSDITNTFVAAGTILGVEEPDFNDFMQEELCLEPDSFPIDSSMYEQGNQALVFLAQAELSADINDSQPVTGASITISSDNGDISDIMMEEGEIDGQYSAGAEQGLEYSSSVVSFTIDSGAEEKHTLSVDAPPAATLDSVPRENAVDNPVSVDLVGQGFHSALMMVINVETGDMSFDNLPQEVEDMYSLAHPEGALLGEETPEIESIELPGSAFPEDGLYAVGVAGLRAAGSDNMNNINLLLSGMIAGKFSFTPVCVPDCYTLKKDLFCETFLAEGQDADFDGDVDQDDCDLAFELAGDGECPDLGQ